MWHLQILLCPKKYVWLDSMCVKNQPLFYPTKPTKHHEQHLSQAFAHLTSSTSSYLTTYSLIAMAVWALQMIPQPVSSIFSLFSTAVLDLAPKREARDVWCLPLSGISGLSFDSTLLYPLLFICLVLLLFLSSVFSACWSILLIFFEKILLYFSLRERLLCMAPV